MPLPIVRPKKHIFYRDWKRKDTSENITLLRYRYNKISDFDEYFVEDYEEELEEICDIVAEKANKELTRLISERAYVSYTSPYYIRTEEFPDAFEVDVSVSMKTGALHFDLIFYFDYLQSYSFKDDIETGKYVSDEGSFSWSLPAHKSLDGQDMRQRLPDILNTPADYLVVNDVNTTGKTKKTTYKKMIRKGRWYETFDKWFRSEGEQLFLKLCRERGLI